MVLVDTSIWVEVFQRNNSFDLETAVDLDEIVTCPAVVQEVLQGFGDATAHAVARDAMLAFPIVESPMPLAAYLEAAELFRAARRVGLTVRSSIDCLIAACAARNSLAILHRDRDFDVLARVAAIEVRSP